MYRFLPNFISESQLGIVDYQALTEHRETLEIRLANASTSKCGAAALKLFGISVAAINTMVAIDQLDPMYFTAASAGLALAGIGQVTEQYCEQTEIVYDYNLTVVESVIQQRDQ